jgi:hypothetical protein
MKQSLCQRQPARAAVAGFRQLAPVHDAGEESRVAVGNSSGQRVLGGRIGNDLLAELTEGFNQLVAEAQDLDPLVFAQKFQPFDVFGVKLSK